MKNQISQEITLSQEEYNSIFELQREILESLALGLQTDKILDMLCKEAEALLPNSVASIMLIDKESGLLNILSAPSVPKEGKQALNGLKPGIHGGSCGNAVFNNEPTYVSDTFHDDKWLDLKQVACDYNICSCWSMPVRDMDKKPLGTFALSSFEHRKPSLFHKKLLEIGANIVNIVLRNEKIEKKIEYLAYHDELTGLYNKTYLKQSLKTEDDLSLLIVLNVDNFSYVNLSYGFDIGDKLLVAIANELKELCSTKDIYRIGADEFAISCYGKINVHEKLDRIKRHFGKISFYIDDISLNISFSCGASFGKDISFYNSSIALKHAQENGKNRYYVYNEENKDLRKKQRDEFSKYNNILRNALKFELIFPYFQGIRDNRTKKITRYEALARIIEQDGVIAPILFLKTAKLSGLLPEITKMMIDKTFKYMSNNNFSFSLNITEDDLSLDYLEEFLLEKAKMYNISTKRVVLEILEGVSSGGKRDHIQQLNSLKREGFLIAIDDFGAEYSNFERVLDLEIDFLKIDAKYIKNIDIDLKSYEIVKSIVYFAKNANISCVAEFVHNKNIQKIVEEMGIEYSQGYYFSEPKEEIVVD